MISLVFAAALLAAGEPAAATTTTSTAPAAADKKAAKDPNAMVCKREAVIGSRFKERVCMTQAQWDQRQKDDRDLVDQSQRARPLTGN